MSDAFRTNADANIQTLIVKTSDMVNKKMFSPEDMPIMNRNIYELVVKESDGNVSQFAEKIGIKQQTFNRIFNTDKRSGKYPSVSDDIKRAIYNKYGITEIQLLSDTRHIIMEEKNNGYNEFSERFLQVVDQLGITDYDIWNSIDGISEEQMSEIRRGVSGASLNIIRDFGKHFEKANIDFILTGRGNPLKTDSETIEIPESNGIQIETEEEYDAAVKKGLHLLPEVSFKFAAGRSQLINISEDITRYWHLPDCKDCEGVAQVVGNSMAPTLPAGCWVALKKYPLPYENPNTIPFGNIFGVVVEDRDTGEYHGHIKILRRYKEQELSRKYWIAHSINEREFDDFDIEIEQVRGLWIVKQHIVSDVL